MAPRKKLLTKTEYAARIGVNKSQISRYCGKGMPAHAGMIDPEEADWWREQHLDQTKPKSKVTPPQQRRATVDKEAHAIEGAAGPARSARPTAPDTGPVGAASPDGAVVTFPDGSSMDLSVIPDLQMVTRIDKFWAGELKRREAMRLDREHISRAEVEAAWDAANTMYRQGLEGVAGRTAAIIAALAGGDAARIEEIIRDEHRTALASVADSFEKAAIFAEGGPAVPPGRDDGEAAGEEVD